MTQPGESDNRFPALIDLRVRIQVDPNMMVTADRWQVDPPPELVPACTVAVTSDIHSISVDSFVPITQAAEQVAQAVTRYLEALR